MYEIKRSKINEDPTWMACKAYGIYQLAAFLSIGGIPSGDLVPWSGKEAEHTPGGNGPGIYITRTCST